MPGKRGGRGARKVDHRRRGGASEIEGVLDRQDAPACCFIPYNLLSHLIRPLVRGVGQRFAPMPRRGAVLLHSPRAETSKGIGSSVHPAIQMFAEILLARDIARCRAFGTFTRISPYRMDLRWIVNFIL